MNADGNDRNDRGSNDGLDSHGLTDLLDRWGADLKSWPDQAVADQARRLIDDDPVAHGHWAQARALDGVLDAVPAHTPPPDLADRIVALATDAPPPSNVVSLAGAGGRRRFGWPSMALAASLLIGLVAGAGVSPDTFDSWLGGTTVDAADYLGFGPPEAGE